jgi:tetratricopeptide (TPR) repeat protein
MFSVSNTPQSILARVVCHACVCSLAALAAVPASAQASFNVCGSLQNAYGPFDYRTQRSKLEIVERYHFSPRAEALISGRSESGTSLGGNIDYTLRASPNHHRALVSMMRYGERLKLPKVPGAEYSVECYFERAVRFAPDDHVVRMLFASYLDRQGKRDLAEKQLELVGREARESAFTLYNVGTVYFDMKNYERAVAYDHRAKALGWQRKDLEEKLRAVGKWRDAVTPPTASAADSAASFPVSAASATRP